MIQTCIVTFHTNPYKVVDYLCYEVGGSMGIATCVPAYSWKWRSGGSMHACMLISPNAMAHLTSLSANVCINAQELPYCAHSIMGTPWGMKVQGLSGTNAYICRDVLKWNMSSSHIFCLSTIESCLLQQDSLSSICTTRAQSYTNIAKGNYNLQNHNICPRFSHYNHIY